MTRFLALALFLAPLAAQHATPGENTRAIQRIERRLDSMETRQRAMEQKTARIEIVQKEQKTEQKDQGETLDWIQKLLIGTLTAALLNVALWLLKFFSRAEVPA